MPCMAGRCRAAALVGAAGVLLAAGCSILSDELLPDLVLWSVSAPPSAEPGASKLSFYIDWAAQYFIKVTHVAGRTGHYSIQFRQGQQDRVA